MQICAGRKAAVGELCDSERKINDAIFKPTIPLLPEGGELEVTTDFLVSLFLIYDIPAVTFP